MKETEEIVRRISELAENKERVIVAIDGACAAGKTTLANELARAIPAATVFHADDFFLRPSQRTSERLTEVGGNLDRERFFDEVISKLSSREEISYRPYDCHKRELSDTVKVRLESVVIVEGTYSMHPALADAYDLKIFMTIDEKEQEHPIF